MNLIQQIDQACRTRHFSPNTTAAYQRWTEHFLRFIRRRDGKWRHPDELTERDVEGFPTHLAINRRTAASTQNQALCALLFLFGQVLKRELGDLSAIRAKRPARRVAGAEGSAQAPAVGLARWSAFV